MPHHTAQKYAAMLATLLLTSQAFAADPTPELATRTRHRASGRCRAHLASDPGSLRTTGRRVYRKCCTAVYIVGGPQQPHLPATCTLRGFRQGRAQCRLGLDLQRCDPCTKRSVPVTASGRARVAQAGRRKATTRWPGPVAHLSGRRQAASRCRQDSASTDVRCADDDGRQGVSVSRDFALHP